MLRSLRCWLAVLPFFLPARVCSWNREVIGDKSFCHGNIEEKCQRDSPDCKTCVSSLSVVELRDVFDCSVEATAGFCAPTHKKPSFSLVKMLYQMVAHTATKAPTAPPRPTPAPTMATATGPAPVDTFVDSQALFKNWVQQKFEAQEQVETQQASIISMLQQKLKAAKRVAQSASLHRTAIDQRSWTKFPYTLNNAQQCHQKCKSIQACRYGTFFTKATRKGECWMSTHPRPTRIHCHPNCVRFYLPPSEIAAKVLQRAAAPTPAADPRCDKHLTKHCKWTQFPPFNDGPDCRNCANRAVHIRLCASKAASDFCTKASNVPHDKPRTQHHKSPAKHKAVSVIPKKPSTKSVEHLISEQMDIERIYSALTKPTLPTPLHLQAGEQHPSKLSDESTLTNQLAAFVRERAPHTGQLSPLVTQKIAPTHTPLYDFRMKEVTPTASPALVPTLKPTLAGHVQFTSKENVHQVVWNQQKKTPAASIFSFFRNGTLAPTSAPTVVPTISPTAEPTRTPTVPTLSPTWLSRSPTPYFAPPTDKPTGEPTVSPTSPTGAPTKAPTDVYALRAKFLLHDVSNPLGQMEADEGSSVTQLDFCESFEDKHHCNFMSCCEYDEGRCFPNDHKCSHKELMQTVAPTQTPMYDFEMPLNQTNDEGDDSLYRPLIDLTAEQEAKKDFWGKRKSWPDYLQIAKAILQEEMNNTNVSPVDVKAKADELYKEDEQGDEPTTTAVPSSVPSNLPTNSPTAQPTAAPSSSPTQKPTRYPIALPTPAPIDLPTSAPSCVPTMTQAQLKAWDTVAKKPSDITSSPTPPPTPAPSASPTIAPTPTPSVLPTPMPSSAPSFAPSSSPSPWSAATRRRWSNYFRVAEAVLEEHRNGIRPSEEETRAKAEQFMKEDGFST